MNIHYEHLIEYSLDRVFTCFFSSFTHILHILKIVIFIHVHYIILDLSVSYFTVIYVSYKYQLHLFSVACCFIYTFVFSILPCSLSVNY